MSRHAQTVQWNSLFSFSIVQCWFSWFSYVLQLVSVSIRRERFFFFQFRIFVRSFDRFHVSIVWFKLTEIDRRQQFSLHCWPIDWISLDSSKMTKASPFSHFYSMSFSRDARLSHQTDWHSQNWAPTMRYAMPSYSVIRSACPRNQSETFKKKKTRKIERHADKNETNNRIQQEK